MSPDSEWHGAVHRMIAKLRGDPDKDFGAVSRRDEYEKAHSLFEVGGDPNEIRRLLVKAIQGAKKNA
ncbi:MAG: hypothetical protein HZA50_11540 [Planctomycetes bacterium]|nr:hypothetical protein [Planctomycetota bacterium]